MLNKLIRFISGKEFELRERIFRTIIVMGGIAALTGIFEIVFVMNIRSLPLIVVLSVLLLAMGATMYATFKHRKYDLASILLGIIIIAIVFPLMFCLSGGIEGGPSVWFVLGIMYVFVMFSGKKLVCFLVLSAVLYGGTYWITYWYPDLIVPLASKAATYIDSYFSVLAVGIIAGVVLKIHMTVFEEEHKLNLAQREELTKNSDTKNTFFANMSHEIRTPINAIIGLNEMILRSGPSTEVKEYAKDIQVASKMLLNQVNDILDLSQVEMNKMKLVPVQYKTKVLFGDLVELIRVQLGKKGLELYVDIDKNLPTVLFGDEKRIKQVVLNLLDNAVKYTEEGSVTLSVQGEACEDGDLLLIVKVADTGIGIRKEDMEHLYDSFNRADEKKNSRIVGSGLGLAITKQLVDLMDGEITVDSIYTKGTVFSVTVKQKVVDAESVGVLNFSKESMEESEFYRPSFEAPEARVLVVDDNRMNSLVASKLLLATKVQVDVAASGAECLEMTKKKFYHVILLDYMMPVMSGVETLQALRKQENGLCRESAVITLTGNAQSGARQLYQEQGFDGYVEKPIQGKLLETEILQFIPTDIIEYQEKENADLEKISQIRKFTHRKRKKIYITCDCVADIPGELVEKYDIKLMYLYIKTPTGRFADTREIDSDSLSQYITESGGNVGVYSGTVEEYEEFFAEILTQAEGVIHISMASRAGESYKMALTAAQGFDHVRVIDSGQVSCGQGLLTLYAAKLAMEGRSGSEIYAAVEEAKNHIQTRFIMPGADILLKNNRTRVITARACKLFSLHPYVAMRQKKLTVVGLLGGNLESAWRQGIGWHLHKRRKINTDVVFITHVGCSGKQLEWIKAEVQKYVEFQTIIVQKASFSTACNSGMMAIGIAYYTI